MCDNGHVSIICCQSLESPKIPVTLHLQHCYGDDHEKELLSVSQITHCSRHIDGDLTLLAAVLDISDEEVATIKSRFKNTRGQALQMLKKWQSSGTHTKQELTEILQDTGFKRAADM